MTKHTTKKTVYLDLENTLTVPFVSGTQRVTLELTRNLAELEVPHWRFIAVRYCEQCKGWLRCAPSEYKTGNAVARQLEPGRSIKRTLTHPALRGLRRGLGKIYKSFTHRGNLHRERLIPGFEPGSIFLDVDSSWHNSLKRSVLLPSLLRDDVRIATMHYDATPLLFPELTHANTVNVFTEHFHAHLENSSLFICISQATERDLIKYAHEHTGHRSIRTTTIGLGDFEVSGDDGISASPLPVQIQYLLCVATIEARKNHAVLLDAFERVANKHPNLGLVLVGREGWNAEQTITRIRNHCLLGSRIFWFENLDDKELARLYKDAFLCVSTSFYEGFGLPISEALSYQCVTICSNTGALAEAAGNYADYIDPTDATGLCNRIEAYLSDPQEYNNRKQSLMNRKPRPWRTTAEELVMILDRHF